MGREKNDKQIVTLNRIVVPSHLRVSPLDDGSEPPVPAPKSDLPASDLPEVDREEAQGAEFDGEAGKGADLGPDLGVDESLKVALFDPTRGAEAPDEGAGAQKEPMRTDGPEISPAFDPFAKIAPPEPANTNLRKLILSAAVLALLVGGLLITGGLGGPEDRADELAVAEPSSSAPSRFEPANPEPPAAAPVSPIPVDDVQPTSAAPAPALLPEPVEPVEPRAATQPVPATPRPQPRPVVEAPPEPAPPALPPLPSSGSDLLDQAALGTLNALRGPGAPLPTAAETALFGFVRSLEPERRSEAELAAMLQRAKDAGTLRVPTQFLRLDGRVNVTAILRAMAQSQ